MRARMRSLATLVVLAAVAMSAAGCGRIMEALLDGPAPSGDGVAGAREAAFQRLIDRLTDPAHAPSGDVVLRLSLTGGWDLPESADLHLSIEDDGRVVRVTDTSVFASTNDFTSLRLSTDGIVRVLESIRPLLGSRREDLDGGAGISSTDRSAWLEVGDAITVSMDRIGRTDGFTPDQQAQRTAFAEVIEGIRSLDWLGEDIVVAEAPWIPDSMTVLAARRPSAGGLSAGTVSWPLERSIETLAQGSQVGPDGKERLVVCLAGDDVAPVFGLLTGVNSAHLGVDDGGAWELDVRPQYPGYRLYGDPCA